MAVSESNLRAMRHFPETAHCAWIAQAHALQIEAQAKMRLADEYDAAQERGEVSGRGRPTENVPDGNIYQRPTEAVPDVNSSPRVTTADLGLCRKDIAGRQAVIVPIVIDEARNVIDGANRLRCAANLHRCHLSREQLRLFIEQRLVRPRKAIAVSPRKWRAITRPAVRRAGEEIGEIPQSGWVQRKGGGSYPARRARQ